jgi:hypothetical protein
VRGFNPIYGRKYWEVVYHYLDPNDGGRVRGRRHARRRHRTAAGRGRVRRGLPDRRQGAPRRGRRADLPDVGNRPPRRATASALRSTRSPADMVSRRMASGRDRRARPQSARRPSRLPIRRWSPGLRTGFRKASRFTSPPPTPCRRRSPRTPGTTCAIINANTFNISLTPTGSLISTASSSQSGTHTIHYGVGTGQALTLPAGAYYPMLWLDERGEGVMSWRKIGYVVTAFAAFSPHGAAFNQKYLPPTGFTPFAPFV